MYEADVNKTSSLYVIR